MDQHVTASGVSESCFKDLTVTTITVTTINDNQKRAVILFVVLCIIAVLEEQTTDRGRVFGAELWNKLRLTVQRACEATTAENALAIVAAEDSALRRIDFFDDCHQRFRFSPEYYPQYDERVTDCSLFAIETTESKVISSIQTDGSCLNIDLSGIQGFITNASTIPDYDFTTAYIAIQSVCSSKDGSIRYFSGMDESKRPCFTTIKNSNLIKRLFNLSVGKPEQSISIGINPERGISTQEEKFEAISSRTRTKEWFLFLLFASVSLAAFTIGMLILFNHIGIKTMAYVVRMATSITVITIGVALLAVALVYSRYKKLMSCSNCNHKTNYLLVDAAPQEERDSLENHQSPSK